LAVQDDLSARGGEGVLALSCRAPQGHDQTRDIFPSCGNLSKISRCGEKCQVATTVSLSQIAILSRTGIFNLRLVFCRKTLKRHMFVECEEFGRIPWRARASAQASLLRCCLIFVGFLWRAAVLDRALSPTPPRVRVAI